ncbi:MAG: ABC transporter permease [Micromonosporaceae bacterium]|nr:ABC transporter permease [Micromonosporaceae bacterium]
MGRLPGRYPARATRREVGIMTAIHAPLAPRGGTASIVGNEVVKGLRLGWSERVQILIELPLFVSFVLLLGYTIGTGDQIVATGQVDWSLDSYHASWLFLGMGSYTFSYLLLQKVFWRLLAEIQTGTLEQTYLSPVPPWVHQAIGRPLASIAETALVVAAMYGVTSLAVRLEFDWRFDALVPLAALIVGAVGLALVVAGLALVWKRIEMLNDLVLMLVMFFSGAAMSLDLMPSWSGPITDSLFMTHAIDGLRTVLLDGQPLAAWGTGGLVWQAATAAGWFVAGVAVFKLSERTVQRRGALSHY